jgi:PAS domain S-box-containing protein
MIEYRKLPVMMHAIDSEGVLIDVNDEWLRKMEYKHEEVIGRKSIEFLTRESRERAVNSILPYFFEQGHCRNVPYQFVTKSGIILEVELSADLVRDKSGDMWQSRAILIDVTERNLLLRSLINHHEDDHVQKVLRQLGILV